MFDYVPAEKNIEDYRQFSKSALFRNLNSQFPQFGFLTMFNLLTIWLLDIETSF